MQSRRELLCCSVLLMLAAALSGCSDGRLPTFPVAGRVVFPDGSPVRTGTIELKSQDHPVQARGTIGLDGSFRLTTYQADDGAVAGKHDCVVVQLVMVEQISGFQPSLQGVVDPRFGSYATSGLQVEVSPSEANLLTVEVRRPGAAARGSERAPPSRPLAGAQATDATVAEVARLRERLNSGESGYG